ncbi:flagellar biosynthetic protein FliR [Sphingobium sp. DEHP117]|uniref:flagellar biosynthetic protein FliR n=1 Tax=Sphingobium sp. DEHP117 TaxID=2993436 RepID=UPI0027D5B597|nr:flagellar biosynthetic protein FliR [Sphingobium sp. DEHP117]MDQ4420669.1 flagellar biosynthetic protein FliR [Sphingobium sp. DEHP117]
MDALSQLAPDLPRILTLHALIFARVGAMLMLLPGFSDDAVPGRIRLLVALALAAGMQGVLTAHMGVVIGAALAGNAALAHLLLVELLTGLMLGGIVRLMFLAVTIAGAIISLQVGLTTGLVQDPSAGGQVPQLARFISIAALLVCMSLGVHHLWIGALVQSYGVFPPGAMAPAADFAQLALKAASGAMALGLGLSAPLVIYGIVFNAALGLAARLAPQLQIFFIAQPLAIALGLALLAVTLGAALSGFAQAMAQWALALVG